MKTVDLLITIII